MRRIKGNTSSRLFEEFPHLKKRYWGEALLGARVLLRDGRADDGRDDQAVPGASFLMPNANDGFQMEPVVQATRIKDF